MPRTRFPLPLRAAVTVLAAGALSAGAALPASAVTLTGGAVDLNPGVVDNNPTPTKPKPTPTKPKGPSGTCKASFYSDPQPTANGERFNPNVLTAAHKTLKFNTRVKVTNKANGKSVTVRINDRGPYVSGRCLDLSRAAMKKVGGISAGVVNVTWQVV